MLSSQIVSRSLAKKSSMIAVDGNKAAAYVGYAMSDTALIYPITPSSPMGEHADEWSAKGTKNAFGQVVKVVEMQAEGGAAGAVHGALSAGSIATTFTASQGLLLMFPNMIKIAGELLPTVFHVASRAVAGQALSIFGDHSDVMAVRSSGFALLSSGTVQECMDLALVAHVASLESRIPFVHFFEGFRLSHEINTVDPIPYSEMTKLIDMDAVEAIRLNGLNPESPKVRGTSQDPAVYFQLVEGANKFYDAVPDIVERAMKKVGDITGRYYAPFEYMGPKDAENVIVVIGSGASPIEDVVSCYGKNDKLGVIKVRLYRPFDVDRFLAVLPKTTKRIAVLDRTKEPGAIGEPLFLDVTAAIRNSPLRDAIVVGGRYGLGSKEFTPAMAMSVYDNLKSRNPKHGFTVGIIDDVSHLSLPLGEPLDVIPETTNQAMFWGLGSDGTVGANKEAIKLIVENTPLYGQGYFSYTAHKSGGLSVSHLRFGPDPINSPYLITNADYVACHCTAYINKYDMLGAAKPNSLFVLNAPWTTLEELDRELPANIKRDLAEKNIRFFAIDASKIADKCNIQGRINMIMQAAFFKLSEVIPVDQAMSLLEGTIKKQYSKYGTEIVENNLKALSSSLTELVEIKFDKKKWAAAKDAPKPPAKAVPEFVKKVLEPFSRLEGNDLPVSAFPITGTIPPGISAYEKRGVSTKVAFWKRPEDCIQCNLCAFECPHAAIRPFILPKGAPVGETLESNVFDDSEFRIQVTPYDCVGCGLCVYKCPANCLELVPFSEVSGTESEKWEYCIGVEQPEFKGDRYSVEGSQYHQPLLEFSGACAGCGETPYVKYVTQVIGQQMVIANATGCSSIWGGSYPVNPYTVNSRGEGPAWANSLFEDNAEYGLGMATAIRQQRSYLKDLVDEALSKTLFKGELESLLKEWSKEDNFKSLTVSKDLSLKIKKLLGAARGNELVERIKAKADLFSQRSIWIIGGDGWAYDIGYGGLDHVIASGENVNILVVDTEVYSNTGGQASKATPRSGVAKFTYSGKPTRKKDLGAMAMTYGDVYVAAVSTSNPKQFTKAVKEAIAWEGPSLIIAYAHCIAHGIKGGLTQGIKTQEDALKVGYWSLYRFNPALKEDGENPFTLDSKKPAKGLNTWLDNQSRFSSLKDDFPALAVERQALLESDINDRYQFYIALAGGEKKKKRGKK